MGKRLRVVAAQQRNPLAGRCARKAVAKPRAGCYNRHCKQPLYASVGARPPGYAERLKKLTETKGCRRPGLAARPPEPPKPKG